MLVRSSASGLVSVIYSVIVSLSFRHASGRAFSSGFFRGGVDSLVLGITQKWAEENNVPSSVVILWVTTKAKNNAASSFLFRDFVDWPRIELFLVFNRKVSEDLCDTT